MLPSVAPAYELLTPRLRLRALAHDELRRLLRGDRAALGARIGATVPPEWPGEQLKTALPAIAREMASLGGDERWVWVILAPRAVVAGSPGSDVRSAASLPPAFSSSPSPDAASPSVEVSPPADALIGDIGFHSPVTGTSSVEIGYVLLPAARGYGYATEATGALIDWAFTRPGVARVTAQIAPSNTASLRVAAKVAMRPAAAKTPGLLCFERLKDFGGALHSTVG